MRAGYLRLHTHTHTHTHKHTHTHIYTHTHIHTHTLTICNTYCFSTATMVARTRVNISVYVYCLLLKTSLYFYICQKSWSYLSHKYILPYFGVCRSIISYLILHCSSDIFIQAGEHFFVIYLYMRTHECNVLTRRCLAYTGWRTPSPV